MVGVLDSAQHIFEISGSLKYRESNTHNRTVQKFFNVKLVCFRVPIVSVVFGYKMKLFYKAVSPPARAALLAIRNLKLDVELVECDLFTGQNLTPDFLKLNPAHQIPVLVDDDLVLSESRAIMGYLVNSRAPGSDLYPSDAKKRAIVDQRLYFDATTVFPRNCAIAVSMEISLVSLVIFNSFRCKHIL